MIYGIMYLVIGVILTAYLYIRALKAGFKPHVMAIPTTIIIWPLMVIFYGLKSLLVDAWKKSL